MNRRAFLTMAGAASLRAQEQKPNVVLIVADDLGWGDISANGCTDIRTPNIDSVAKAGARFTQSYANAPECTPTRCALLTGRYQQRVGGLECAIGVNNIGRYDEAAWLQKQGELGLPASEMTLGREFKARGYDTAIFGKWHLGYLEKFWPNQHGFAESFAILGGNADYFTHEEQGEGLGKTQSIQNGRKVKRSGYMTDLIAKGAIDWLKKSRGKPFFLYVPFTAPHTPIQAAEDYDPKTNTAPHRPKNRQTFAKMVERMDTRIGDLLKQLDGMGAAENTIVVFTSDNGADANGRNDPFRGSKSSVWEGGIRVPLHIRWPRAIPAGREVTQPSMTMDLAPTLLRGSTKSDGIDLLPFAKGEKATVERTMFWRYKRGDARRRAVRHGDWKYVDDNGELALHDLRSDPMEQKNLVRDRPHIVRDLRARLTAWEEEVKAPRLRTFQAE